MKEFLIKSGVNFFALFMVVNVVGGIAVDGWEAAVTAALILTFINTFLKPAIIFLTLPINILSLGMLTFVINGFLFFMVSKVVKGFFIANFWSAFFGALLFSIVSVLLNLFIKPRVKIHVSNYSSNSTPPPDDAGRLKYREIIDVEAEEDKKED